MKNLYLTAVSILILSISGSLSAHNHGDSHSHHGKDQSTVQVIPGEGERVRINDTHYFTWSFDKKPAVGAVVLNLRVFDSAGKQVTPFKIYADFDMPSMRGAHGLQALEFSTADNAYSRQLRVLMRGQWEIVITIKDSGREIYKGRILLRV